MAVTMLMTTCATTARPKVITPPPTAVSAITRQWRVYKLVLRSTALAWIGFVAFVVFSSPPAYALICGVALFFFIRFDLWRCSVLSAMEEIMVERQVVLTPSVQVWRGRLRSMLWLGVIIGLYVSTR